MSVLLRDEIRKQMLHMQKPYWHRIKGNYLTDSQFNPPTTKLAELRVSLGSNIYNHNQN